VSQRESSTLVRGAWVLAMAPDRELFRDGAVLIGPDGAIAEVGGAAELGAANPDAEVVGDQHGVVLPGLVNAHTHLTESLITGMAEDATLFEWFSRIINPAGSVITRDDMVIGTRLRAVEMLRSGITTVNEMSAYGNVGSLAALGAVDGLAEMGMRAQVSFGAADNFPGGPGLDAVMAEHEALADRVNGEELIGFRTGIATILALTDELFTRTIDASVDNGWAVHTHAAEVREEITESRTRHGHGTIERAYEMGLFEVPVIAAHCVWCTPGDIGLLASKHATVAHNPVSNMLLGSGVMPLAQIRGAGIPVGLGTDGAASNDNQDMFAVLKIAGLLHKVSALDPAALTAPDVVRMATLEGARAMGLEDRVGSLEPGKRADVVLLDGNQPELAAIHDPFQAVVNCATARCVSDVWVDGKQRVSSGEVVDTDIGQIVAEARAAAIELAKRADLGAESVYAGPGRVENLQASE
jgi:5-methylthioadenosine/S-adenosylhomocysteine deaminase